jgi:hypothetical protein
MPHPLPDQVFLGTGQDEIIGGVEMRVPRRRQAAAAKQQHDRKTAPARKCHSKSEQLYALSG